MNRHQIVFEEQWSDRSVKQFKAMLEEAKTVHFRAGSSALVHPEILFGQIIIEEHSEKFFKAGTYLIREEVAMAMGPNSFMKYFNMTTTKNIERWNDNQRGGGILHETEIEAEMKIMPATGTFDGVLPPTKEDVYVLQSPPCHKAQQKVLDWLERNEESDPSNSDIDSLPDTLVDQAQELASKIKASGSGNDAPVPVCLPAGAQITNYCNLGKKNSKSSLPNTNSSSIPSSNTISSTSSTDEEFVSISQVGLRKNDSTATDSTAGTTRATININMEDFINKRKARLAALAK